MDGVGEQRRPNQGRIPPLKNQAKSATAPGAGQARIVREGQQNEEAHTCHIEVCPKRVEPKMPTSSPGADRGRLRLWSA
jgi:hypothetical protein